MTYFSISEKSSQGKRLIEYLKTLDFVKFIDGDSIPNKTTLKAMEEVEKSNLKTFKSFKKLMKDLNS